MTDRELRNAEWKQKIRNNAEEVCRIIDSMEEDIKDRERMASELAAEIDRMRQEQKEAA